MAKGAIMGARATVRTCRLALALLFAASGALADGDEAMPAEGSAAQGSFRAAQEKGLDLSLDHEALRSESAEYDSPAPDGSYRAAQDVPEGVDWSRRLGKKWVVDPVALNRRQDGTLDEPNADVPDQVLGIEVRRPF